MLRTIKDSIALAVAAVGSLIILTISSPLLFWLGRVRPTSSEMLVDQELLADDPGVDVDEP